MRELYMKLSRILALFIFAFALPATAQQYPTKPVRVLIGYAAGSSTDIVGRVMADRFGANWKHTVIVENRRGAAGNVAAHAAAQTAGEGRHPPVAPNTLEITAPPVPQSARRAFLRTRGTCGRGSSPPVSFPPSPGRAARGDARPCSRRPRRARIWRRSASRFSRTTRRTS